MDKIAPKTIHDLQEIITRCFEEAEKAEYVKKITDDPHADTMWVVKNRQELIRHISHTIIGELYELEIVRKLQPVIRMLPNLFGDFQSLDAAEDNYSNKMNLRFKDHIEK